MTSPDERKELLWDVYVANSDDIHLVAAPDEDAARGVARRILRKGVTDYSVIRSMPWETGPAHFTWQESDGRIGAEPSETDKLRPRISALEAKLKSERERADRAEAEIARLKERVKWQPIETAPRDGTWFLCYDPSRLGGDFIQCAKWIYADDDGEGPDTIGGLWVAEGREKGSATHWTPLPALLAQPNKEG
jgi:hypothetical protein